VKKTIFLLTGFLVIGLLGSSPVSAALDITVSPVFLNFSPNPGETITDKVTLHNNTGSPVVLDISINKMTVNDRGDIVPEEISSTDSASKWFKLNSSKLTAPALEWVDIPVTIKVPADAAYGNYFAIVFSAQADKALSGASVQGNVLIPVLLNVKKEGAIAKADISNFSVKNFVTEYLPVEFNISVKNSGNIHLAPRGNIFIRGSGTKDLAILEVNPAKGNILPNSARDFSVSWKDGFVTKNADGKLEFNWNKLTSFRLGKYTAYSFLVYDDGVRDVPIESTITFWVFPYTAFAILAGSLILVLIILNLSFKSMVKKAAQKISTPK